MGPTHTKPLEDEDIVDHFIDNYLKGDEKRKLAEKFRCLTEDLKTQLFTILEWKESEEAFKALLESMKKKRAHLKILGDPKKAVKDVLTFMDTNLVISDETMFQDETFGFYKFMYMVTDFEKSEQFVSNSHTI